MSIRSKRARTLPTALVLPLVLAFGDRAEAGVYPVGNGAGCYPSLAAALVAATGDPEPEIRLVQGALTSSNSVFIRQSVTIRGGYSSCSASEPVPGSFTTLESPNSRTLFVEGAVGARRQVTIEGVHVLGYLFWPPGGTAPGRTAGGIVARGPVDLTLRRVVVYASHSTSPGGGLSLFETGSGAPTVVTEDSHFTTLSSESDGGAIACSGGSLRIRRGSLDHSHAGRFGGGLSADGCQVVLDNVTVVFNTAGNVGGGAAIVGMVGNAFLDARRVLWHRNEGFNAAGGLSVNSAEAHLFDNKFLDNRAALAKAFQVYAGVMRVAGRGCTVAEAVNETTRCSAIASHDLGSDRTAVGLRAGAVLDLTGTTVTGNRGGTSSVVVHSRDSNLRIASAALVDNPAGRLVRFESADAGIFLLEHTTVAGNAVAGGHFEMLGPNPRFEAYSVLHHGAGRPFWHPSSSVSPYVMSCIVADEALSASDFRYSADPGLAPDGVHLVPTSLAIDACRPLVAATPDIDGQDFGFDHPERANPPGYTADAGADEVNPVPAGAIFSDGFESGTMGAWSSG